MPRQKRLDIPGVPQHVVQRGTDRQACFFRDVDYARYRHDLREAALRTGCLVHAYVLMTNHVHLLVTPLAAGAIGRMMQAVGRRYVRYINANVARTGTLWEGRYKASLVDSEHYVLACHRYIELNPVRAGMVANPAEYRWSSHRCHALGEHDPLLSPHACYLAMSPNEDERRQRYRELVMQGVPAHELDSIRLYVQRQRALGSSRFQEQIARQLARRTDIGQPGRPRKRTEKVL